MKNNNLKLLKVKSITYKRLKIYNLRTKASHPLALLRFCGKLILHKH